VSATTSTRGAGRETAGKRAGNGVSILRLMRIDPAVNRWYIGTIVAAGMGSLFHMISALAGRLDWVSAPRGPFEAFFLLMLWFFFFIVVMANATTHSTRLSMALPIDARKVWLARILSVLIVSCAPVVATTIVVGSRWPEGAGALSFETGMLRAGLHAVAAVILAVFLLQAPNVRLARQRRRADYVVYAIFFGLMLTAISVPTVGIVPVSVGMLVIAAVIAAGIWRAIPEGFVTHRAEPDGPAAVERPRADAVSGDARPSGAVRLAPGIRHRYITLARILANSWGNWANTILLAFYITLLIAAYSNGEMDNPFSLFIFIWVFASMMYGVRKLYAIDHLPISRRALFAVVFAPSLIGAVLGIGGGMLWTAAGHENARLVFFHDNSVDYPGEFMRISTEGPPPALTSPWGETHPPKSAPLWPGSRIYVFKPYDSGPDSSPRFAFLQVDRALEAINGIAPEDPPGTADPSDERAALRERLGESVGKGSPVRSRAWAVGAIVAFAIFSLVLHVQFRFGGRVARWNPLGYIVPLVTVAILVVIGGVVAAGRLGYVAPWAYGALPAILCRRAAEALPFPTAVLWLMAAAVGVAGIASIERAFSRIESPLAQKQSFYREY